MLPTREVKLLIPCLLRNKLNPIWSFLAYLCRASAFWAIPNFYFKVRTSFPSSISEKQHSKTTFQKTFFFRLRTKDSFFYPSKTSLILTDDSVNLNAFLWTLALCMANITRHSQKIQPALIFQKRRNNKTLTKKPVLVKKSITSTVITLPFFLHTHWENRVFLDR